MNAKRLIAMSILALAAGATFAAFNRNSAESQRQSAASACAETTAAVPAIPRVVVTARRDLAQSTETPVARVVVTASRLAAASSLSITGL